MQTHFSGCNQGNFSTCLADVSQFQLKPALNLMPRDGALEQIQCPSQDKEALLGSRRNWRSQSSSGHGLEEGDGGGCWAHFTEAKGVQGSLRRQSELCKKPNIIAL